MLESVEQGLQAFLEGLSTCTIQAEMQHEVFLERLWGK